MPSVDLVLCHTTADFDTLGAAVGLARLQPGRRIVLTGGCHPTVQQFLALYRDEYPLLERRAVNPDQLRQLVLVDAQQRDRFGPAAAWIAQAEQRQTPILIYDHHACDRHGGGTSDVAAQERVVEPVGAATTLVVEALQRAGLTPTAAEATVMALGIHADTGSLTYEGATSRDAAALAWLMAQEASLAVIADFVEPGLSPRLQGLLTEAMGAVQLQESAGQTLAWVLLAVEGYVPGLSGLAERLISLVDAEALLLGAYSPAKDEPGGASPGQRSTEGAGTDGNAAGFPPDPASPAAYKLTLIARSRGRLGQRLDWGGLLSPLGGGGHPVAAAASLTTDDPQRVMAEMMAAVRSQLPPQPTARDLMSSPVRTIRPETTIAEAQRILLRYGHSGLSVVDEGDRLVGIISRRDIDLALHHGFSHAPVKGYMATQLKTIAPETPLAAIEELMVTYDIGRLPVLAGETLVGIVTRTDLLRHRHPRAALPAPQTPAPPAAATLQRALEHSLAPELRSILHQAAAAAQARGWHLYLVGGAVRDLLLRAGSPPAALPDLDLVVDGFFHAAQAGAGVDLATALKASHPEADIQVHGRFQTASLVWRRDLDHPLAGLMVDIATARTEFYPYPAANPEVEASSIQQDLYRRDFTINALALRLTQPGAGQLIDYFGGLIDLRQETVRVLHANSFIEDPTRIYRAVRFAVRLGFRLDPQTEGYIHHAIASGIYTQMQRQVRQVPALQTRLKQELKYILEAPYWQAALELLDQMGALRCLHSDLAMTPALWQQLRRLSRWARRLDWADLEEPWLLRLEGLLAAVPETERSPLAAALQLPQRSVDRLGQLDNLERSWQALVAQQPPASTLYSAFSQVDVALLLLVAARHPRQLGPSLWRHLRHWATLSPLLNGHRLQALGYCPGPVFRLILDGLLAAQIDGTVTTVAEAEAFVAQHYPLA